MLVPSCFCCAFKLAWLSGPEFKVNYSYCTKLFSDIISLLSCNSYLIEINDLITFIIIYLGYFDSLSPTLIKHAVYEYHIMILQLYTKGFGREGVFP